MSEIRIIKLTSGEELIARIVKETSVELVVNKARAVHAMPLPDGMTYRISLVPFSPAVPDGDITLYKNNFTANIEEQDIPSEFVSEYTRQTTDIQIVSSDLSSIITG